MGFGFKGSASICNMTMMLLLVFSHCFLSKLNASTSTLKNIQLGYFVVEHLSGLNLNMDVMLHDSSTACHFFLYQL